MNGESVFDQLYKQAHKKSTQIFSPSDPSEAPFRAKFVGENSYDAGGPFRDVMENICTEITERFFKPTSNMDSLPDVTSHQPRLLTSTHDLRQFELIGKMIGWALTSTLFNLSLDLNPIFWKRLLGIPIVIEDLKEVDIYRYQVF